MLATVRQVGSSILCVTELDHQNQLRLSSDDAMDILQESARRYSQAIETHDKQDLYKIGLTLLRLLNKHSWATKWVNGIGPRKLEIQATEHRHPLAKALLDAPWELLACEDLGGYLADDAISLFVVVRRIGLAEKPAEPVYKDGQLMFMASAPREHTELDFELEEASILRATERLKLHVVVEESGALELLGERLALESPFEMLHLSCHGGVDNQKGPYVVLEDEAGDADTTLPEALAAALGEPGGTLLLFLSACRTAQSRMSEDYHEPFSRELVRSGVPNVLGRSGSVGDADAIEFSQVFYRELAGYKNVPWAVARARHALRLLAVNDPTGSRGGGWHLARLYLGPKGGGAVANSNAKAERRLTSEAYGRQFLDKARSQIPVASRVEFVGRRREVQAILRVFRDGGSAVIHGMSNLGKSSLAARVASRLTEHRTVVIFDRFDPLSVFDRVLKAVPPRERNSVRSAWRKRVERDPIALVEALEELLGGILDQSPILLIVDDLERVLEGPTSTKSSVSIREDFQATLEAIITAFRETETKSRLLFTTRYLFECIDNNGDDLAATLDPISITPLKRNDRIKQYHAALRVSSLRSSIQARLVNRMISAAAGNPGVQAAVTLLLRDGEFDKVEALLDSLESYFRTGNALVTTCTGRELFERMNLGAYKVALSPSEGKMLQASLLFSSGLPVPIAALYAAGSAAGVCKPQLALEKLINLGLVDNWQHLSSGRHGSVNQFARPMADRLQPEMVCHLSAEVLPVLWSEWGDSDGNFEWSDRALEVTRLALEAPTPNPRLLQLAASSAARYVMNHAFEGIRSAYEQVLKPALAKLSAIDAKPGIELLLCVCDCSEKLIAPEARQEALQSLESVPTGPERGMALLYLGRWHRERGDFERAKDFFAEAAIIWRELEEWEGWAVNRGEYATTIKDSQPTEALRIHREEELPVYRQLGNVRSVAITQQHIAEIESHNDREGALDLLRRQFPVFERIGDKLAWASAKGTFAEILGRYAPQEALSIRINEELPVYESMADRRSVAVALGKVADLFEKLNRLDEAYDYRKRELIFNKRIKDAQGKAISRGKIAVLQMRRKRPGQWLQCLRKQFDVLRDLGVLRYAAVANDAIAEALAFGTESEREEAIRRLEWSKKVHEDLDDQVGVSRVELRLAFILGFEDPRAALEIAQQQLSIHSAQGDDRTKAIILKQMLAYLIRLNQKGSDRYQAICGELAQAYCAVSRSGFAQATQEIENFLGIVLATGHSETVRFLVDEIERIAKEHGDNLSVNRALHMRRALESIESTASGA